MKMRINGVFLLALCAFTSSALGGATVLTQGSTVAGKPIGEWTADWWNWANSVPGNVFADTTGALQNVNQSGPVYFVAGTTGGAAVTRTFDIPPDKFVLFPLLNWFTANGADPGFASTEEEVVALVDGTIDPAALFATIDGTDINNLGSHREKAPTNFTLKIDAGTTGFPPGTYTDANADGYWLMLEPLSAGAHTLRFGGVTKDYVGPDPAVTVASFTVDTTANVTVGGATAIPLPTGVLGGLPMLGVAAVAYRASRRRSIRV